MGLFSEPSSHNKGSLLSFCLIKSCLKCLTPLEETLVISLTPLDLTYDWVLRCTDWKWKCFRKKFSKSNFLNFSLEAALRIKWVSHTLPDAPSFHFPKGYLLLSMSVLTRFLHSVIQNSGVSLPPPWLIPRQWWRRHSGFCWMFCVSVLWGNQAQNQWQGQTSVLQLVCVWENIQSFVGGGGRAEEGTSRQIWWSIYLTSVALTWDMFSPDFSPLTLNKDSLRLI